MQSSLTTAGPALPSSGSVEQILRRMGNLRPVQVQASGPAQTYVICPWISQLNPHPGGLPVERKQETETEEITYKKKSQVESQA